MVMKSQNKNCYLILDLEMKSSKKCNQRHRNLTELSFKSFGLVSEHKTCRTNCTSNCICFKRTHPMS